MAGTNTNLEDNETHTNPLNYTFSSVSASTSENEPIVNQTGSTFSNTKTDQDATNLNQELGNQATSYNQKGSKFLTSPNVTATLAHPTSSLIPTTTDSDYKLATSISTTNRITKTTTFSTSTNTINSKPTDTNLTHTQNFTPTTTTQSVIHSTLTKVNSNTNPAYLATYVVSPNETKFQTARISPGHKEVGIADKFVSRNTVDQRKLEFQRYLESGLPSYWNCSNQTSQKSTDKVNVARGEGSRSHRFVEVDKVTREAITDLATSTWDFQRVGLGVDAQGLTHRSMQVVSVQRIENKNLFYAYDFERKRMWSLGGPYTPVGQVQGSKGNVLTSRYLAPFMRDQLYDDINEHYLFHGTDPSLVDAIASNGLDPRISHCRNMLGTAIHFAESSTKSDQYTDRFIGRRRNTETQTMFLVRVLLGNVFLINEKHESVRSKDARKLSRPPCIVCLQDFCNCPDQELYGSVMADGKWIFREFALYDKNLCYPEYLIKYRRL